MAIYHTDCTPYISATLFHVADEDPRLVGQLRKAIADTLRPVVPPGSRSVQVARRFSLPAAPDDSPEGMEIAWLHYEEKRPPPWYSASALKDTYHHLAVVCRKSRLVAICFSDSTARNLVVRVIAKATTAPFDRLKRLSPAEIEATFVEGRVRTLWLSGAHRRSPIKPDAKVLSGLELESALDPLDDQTYYFSSVRSTSSNQLLVSGGRSAVIGASPRHARIWIGPTRSWDEFTGRMALVLDQAAEKTAAELPSTPSIPILAQPTSGVDGVEQPYEMAVIVPELAVAGVEHDDGEERWLQQFSDAVRFDISAVDGSPNFDADVFWGDEQLGRLAYEFEPRSGGEVGMKVGTIQWGEGEEHHQDLRKICQNSDNLTVYFDTGHIYARGQLYRTQFRDAQFTDWRWVNMAQDNIVVRQEKPVDGRRFAVENIGDANDRSLFGLVARNWPDLEDRGAPRGWLVCDDGSMESADFIHFDETANPPRLTLIHVKGSHSDSADRGVSVSDHEVVVGQAVKNLRHVDRGILIEKLASNSDGQLRDAVWRDGERQQDRAGVLEVLRDAGANMEKRVVVLQPRVRRSVHDRIRLEMTGDNASSEIRRMQQLDALLLGARAACYALGASFEVIAEDDL